MKKEELTKILNTEAATIVYRRPSSKIEHSMLCTRNPAVIGESPEILKQADKTNANTNNLYLFDLDYRATSTFDVSTIVDVIVMKDYEFNGVTLKGTWNANGNIEIHPDSFEHLLNCLDNQKYIHEMNADATECDYKQIQQDNQQTIDSFNTQCRELLNNETKHLTTLTQFVEDAVKTESVVDAVVVNSDYILAILQILIAGGNLLDQLKKNIFYEKPIDGDDRAKHVTSIIEAMDSKALFMEDPTKESELSMLPVNTRLFHAIIGITTESTELLENLTGNGGDIDTINMLEEFSDIDWYKAIGVNESKADWGQMLDVVIKKLKERYPDKFNAADAINRDTNKERTILEQMDHVDKI